jgi:hypothetical protein
MSSTTSYPLSLYQLLVESPALDYFNQHIQQHILPRIIEADGMHSIIRDYIVQYVLPSPWLMNKKFICLVWYATNVNYAKRIDQLEFNKSKITRFKELLQLALDRCIAGITPTGQKYDFKNSHTTQHRFKHSLGYFIDLCRQDYINS